MSTTKKTEVILQALPLGKVDKVLSKISSSGIEMEFLKPEELGSDWEKVTYLKSEKARMYEESITDLENALSLYQPKGFLSGMLDLRIKVGQKDLQNAKEDEKELLEILSKIKAYAALKDELKASQDSKVQKNQKEQREALEKEVEALDEDLKAVISNQGGDAAKKAIEDIKIIQTKLEEIESNSFVHILKKLTDLKEGAKEGGVDLDSIGAKMYRRLASLHAAYKIESIDPKKNVFLTSADAKVGFLFVTIRKETVAKFSEILAEEGIVFSPVDWNEEIITWENKGAKKAFQDVATGVGVIGSKEFDPTSLILVFFSLFFAFCLGDAIYGLILVSITGYLLFTKKLKSGVKSMMNLFFYSGVATLIFGVLTGSWAGNFLSKFTGLGEVLKKLTIFDMGFGEGYNAGDFLLNNSLKDAGMLSSPVVTFLVISGAIGFLHSIIGYTIAVINEKKQGNTKAALENLFWVFFVVFGAASIIPGDTRVFFLSVFVLSWLGMILFSSSKSIVGKIFSGFGKIYNSINVIADSLSYMRLAATGLSTVIIALVINAIASNFIEGGGIGVVLAIAILVVGHLFNLVVSTFGAYINPLRLHYVEFMPKFYDATGRLFAPQNDGTEYVEIEA